MSPIDNNIRKKISLRDTYRKEKNFSKADEIRDALLLLGYSCVDGPNGTIVTPVSKTDIPIEKKKGMLAIFGSGELSSTGRAIHEQLIQRFLSPVHISLLVTPAGFEANPYHWYQKLKDMMMTGLSNYHPEISLIPALRSIGEQSTNDPVTLSPLLSSQYIHTGAGSPTYAVKHLKDTEALRLIKNRLEEGASVSFASAAAIACGAYVLPVYELYYVGQDLHWETGADLYATLGLPFSIIPHWDNAERGADIDTRYAFMGEKRFLSLLKLVPNDTLFVGVDEHTALMLDVERETCRVEGKGAVHVFRAGDFHGMKTCQSGSSLSWGDLLV